VDVKLFVTGGFYAFARPVEAAFLCFTENGLCAVDFDFALGVGFAFGGVTRERR
jgi:hypothetical protein